MMLKRNRQRGFTLIELLIVVAIIGIIAAILVPNLIDALQKAKQKRTVSDLRNVGTAWMSWLTDQVSAAAAGGQPYAQSQLTAVTYPTLLEYLNPAGDATFYYMQDIPELDGWKHPYVFMANVNLLASTVLALCSPGRDGTAQKACLGTDLVAADTGPFVATNYDHDIMWADGFFVMNPLGTGTAAAAGP